MGIGVFAWRTGTELESVNEGFTKYHIRLTDTPGWYGVWDKKVNKSLKVIGDLLRNILKN